MSCPFCAERPSNSTLSIGQTAYHQQQYAKAFQFLAPLAHGGDIVAQCLLGFMFQLGLGVEKDIAAAKRWYQQAGLQGCALSSHNLATIFSIDELRSTLVQYYCQKTQNMGLNLAK